MSSDKKKNCNSNKNGFVWSSAISGSISNIITRLITHPMDSIKSKLQIQNSSKFGSIKDVLYHTYKEEGLLGFYRGFNITIIGSIPATALFFGSYEYAKEYLYKKKYINNKALCNIENKSLIFNIKNRLNSSDFLSNFIAGMFAETISCLIFVPVDIIRERRQVQINLKQYKYKNDYDALKQIINKEGLRGIYKAYFATLGSFGPMSAFYFSFYELAKGRFIHNDSNAYLNSVKDKRLIKLKLHESIICSLFASACSAYITSPLDLVKFRMQVQRASNNFDKKSAEYRNLVQGLYRVAYNEGFKGLYRGACARVISVAPQGTITMTLVEQLKPLIGKILNEESI